MVQQHLTTLLTITTGAARRLFGWDCHLASVWHTERPQHESLWQAAALYAGWCLAGLHWGLLSHSYREELGTVDARVFHHQCICCRGW